MTVRETLLKLLETKYRAGTELPGTASSPLLSLDSLDELEIIMHLEATFGVVIPDEEIAANCPMSIDTLVGLFESRISTDTGVVDE